jgi:hypothetical protein
MKHLFFLFIFISNSVFANSIVPDNKTKPATTIPVESDETDGKVVLANVASMLGSIGMLSTDPYNPAVAGPSLAQIGMCFINIITQIFKSHGIDEEITRACIEQWFLALDDSEKTDILRAFTQYAAHVRRKHYCPQCECSFCTSTRLDNCGECR